MAITSSIITENAVQVDGRRWIREKHTDHTGAQHFYSYIAHPGQDVDAILAARATALWEQLVEEELQKNEEEAVSADL